MRVNMFFCRRYLFELVPQGLFGILLARVAQFARLVRCWENSAIFVSVNSVERFVHSDMFVET